eukprot:1120062-Amorphochlora_amoeboformis.AAC.1
MTSLCISLSHTVTHWGCCLATALRHEAGDLTTKTASQRDSRPNPSPPPSHSTTPLAPPHPIRTIKRVYQVEVMRGVWMWSARHAGCFLKVPRARQCPRVRTILVKCATCRLVTTDYRDIRKCRAQTA